MFKNKQKKKRTKNERKRKTKKVYKNNKKKHKTQNVLPKNKDNELGVASKKSESSE